jgi:hypothetical protein
MKILEHEGETVLNRMTSRYRQVDAILKTEAEAHPELAGMSTTMTVCGSLGRDLFIGHVDSLANDPQHPMPLIYYRRRYLRIEGSETAEVEGKPEG